MGFWFDQFATIVFNVSLSAAVMLAVVLLLIVVCPQPARRIRLIRGALLGLLLLIPLEFSGILPRLDLWSIVQRGDVAFVVAAAEDSTAELPLAEPPHDKRSSRILTLRVVVTAYALGVLGALAWLGLGCLASLRTARGAIEPSQATLELYLSLPVTRPSPRPELRVAACLRSPMLVGFLRPTILLPVEYDDPEPTFESRERLRVSLLHELAHHEAGDPGLLWVARLAHAFWFFLPPLGWVVERMRLDQELLADRRAALGFGPVGDYAASLLDLAALSLSHAGTGDQRAMLSEVVEEVGSGRLPDDPMGSPLFQRLRMLLQAPIPVETSAPSWWSWALPGLTAVLTLGAASLAVLPASAARDPLLAVDRPGGLFTLASLEVPAAKAQPNGRAPRVELPIPLPASFDLTVEVLATPRELAGIRIAGQPVGTVDDAQSPAMAETPSWQIVRLQQEQGAARLWINGRNLAVPPDRDPFPVWLTLESPPDHDGRYRRLRLRW